MRVYAKTLNKFVCVFLQLPAGSFRSGILHAQRLREDRAAAGKDPGLGS